MRALAGIPANYKVLFLQGGASLQFSMVPMNLLHARRHGRLHRDRRLGEEGAQGSEEASARPTSRRRPRTSNFKRIPSQARLKLTPGAAYVHMTSNNTIYGTEWLVRAGRRRRPARLRHVVRHLLAGRSTSRSSASSTPARRRTSGPSGVTVVIVREDLLARSADTLPTMLNYRTACGERIAVQHAAVFGIYILRLVLKWLLAQGGLTAIRKVNERKAGLLYDELDRTDVLAPHAERTAGR